MQFKLTYAEALEAHPNEVVDILDQLRRSRSKFKNEPLETFEWFYGIAVTIDGLNIYDLLAGKKEYDADFTLDEKVADYMTRCSTHLCARRKTARFYSPVQTPEFIGQEHRKYLKSRERKSASFRALPIAEQDVRLKKAITDAHRGGTVLLTKKK